VEKQKSVTRVHETKTYIAENDLIRKTIFKSKFYGLSAKSAIIGWGFLLIKKKKPKF
jgi:hypothetical protein